MVIKETCSCGEIATWFYASSSSRPNPYYCDECVPRGCECNWHSVSDDTDINISDFSANRQPTDDDMPWKWITHKKHPIYGSIKKGKIWVYLDEKNREYPCGDYIHDENGFDTELSFWGKVKDYIGGWWKRH